MNKVSIYGGLGNQMFQYALCVALNEKGKKTQLAFSDFLYRYHHNGFNLAKAFRVKLPLGQRMLSSFLVHGEFIYKNKLARGAAKFYLNRVAGNQLKIYTEKKEFEYDPEVFLQDSCFFTGIWQVEEYFREFKTKLQAEFEFKEPVDRTNKEMIEKINSSSNSVSIHVRRGDYVTSAWATTHAVINDAVYYNNAIGELKKSVQKPEYFVFSDDINWVKTNLALKDCHYVDHNQGKNSYIDMYLMSLCKHNIIANSTFSWWGAWLNKNKDKVVIMPATWKKDDPCPGIFPREWIKVKVS